MWIHLLRRGLYAFLIFALVSQSDAAGVKLRWQPNPESDLAGYRVHYGTKSDEYEHKIDVGKQTEHRLDNLQESVVYYFSLTAYDQTGNESPYSNQVSFKLGDTTPPLIASVAPLSLTEIQVRFSETVEAASANLASNYQIADGPKVLQAALQSDQQTVHLKTEAHQNGKQYTLSVQNIKDRALPPNTIAAQTTAIYSFASGSSDTTPPTLVLATLAKATELHVFFSEPVTAGSAEEKANYSIQPGIQVLSASLDAGGTVATLQTTEHQSGQSYILTVNNIKDRAAPANAIAINSRYTYSYAPGDIVGPMISLVSLPDARHVEILFNETLDETSAEQATHYTIDNSIAVHSASLDASGRIVTLETDAHVADKAYMLTISQVCDNSINRNPISPQTTYSYVYTELDRIGPTITRVDVLDQTHIRVLFSEAVDKSSAEMTNHYRLSHDLQILSASLDLGGSSVTLTTSAQTAGTTYTLTVNQIFDLSPVGNEILPNTTYSYTYQPQSGQNGPNLVQVTVETVSTLVLEFSVALDRTSAETIDHYQINRGITVYSAQLDESATRVRLQTSPHEPNNIYLLSVVDVTDQTAAHNPIPPNTLYAYQVHNPDHVGPLITMVQVLDAEHIDVLFNERINREQAEKISNYQISGDIQVREAHLAGSKLVVHLTTSAHKPNRLYLLRLNGIIDESAAQNPVAANTSYAYLYEPQDEVPPAVAMVQAIDATHVRVTFSEAVDAISATKPSAFLLNNETTVRSARLLQDHVVELETTPLYTDRVYILLVSGVCDAAQNEIPANSSYVFTFGTFQLNSGPRITGINAQSVTKLLVSWDQPLDKSSAEKTTNFQIQSGVRVLSAQLDSSRKVVSLTTSEHEMQKIYVLIVNGIAVAGQPSLQVAANSPFTYLVWQNNDLAPIVKRVDVLGERLLQVAFDKPVDRLSALNRKNYWINNEITLLSAELDMTGKIVYLETSRHKAGTVYTLTANGIRSASSSLEFAYASSSIAYTYLPNLQVAVESEVETSLSYLDVGRQYYLDRNYVVTKVPDRFRKVKMLMTLNNDRSNTQSRYMTIKLSQAAFVYVAYDSRAESVPNWLDARFNKTGFQVSVSDNAKELDLWQGYFENGVVTLGGNNAPGARGAYSMYIVFFEEPDFSQLPEGSNLEGYWGNGAALPETPELQCNYPNPFNPTTTIPFALPYDMSVKVEIFNVLGQRVRSLVDQILPGGQHRIVWDSRNEEGIPVSAGLYFYRLQVWENTVRNGMKVKENDMTFTRKMLLIK